MGIFSLNHISKVNLGCIVQKLSQYVVYAHPTHLAVISRSEDKL